MRVHTFDLFIEVFYLINHHFSSRVFSLISELKPKGVPTISFSLSIIYLYARIKCFDAEKNEKKKYDLLSFLFFLNQ